MIFCRGIILSFLDDDTVLKLFIQTDGKELFGVSLISKRGLESDILRHRNSAAVHIPIGA